MVSRTAATQDDLRRHNLARLLRRVHESGDATRSELVAYSGLNRSTVGGLVSELSDAGLVVEGAGSAGQVGRPSLVVQADRDSAVVVAFDLRVERTVAALVGLGGEVIARREQRHRRSYTPQSAAKTISTLTRQVLAEAPRRAAWVGIGVGVPGIVDHTDGSVRLAPNLSWVDVPFGDMVRETITTQFGFTPTVWISNDADLGAIAEHVRGVGSSARNLIYLSGDVGIGAGVIIDGRLMSGAGGYGGEVGHMIINPDGAECRCGARGCWETEIGRDAILRAAGGSGDAADIAEVLAATRVRGGKGAGVEGVGDWLGIGLANLVNLFNPEVIVLGGDLRIIFPMVTGQVLRRIRFSLPGARDQVRVEVPALNGDSTLLGAAETAFEDLLADPIEVLSTSHHAVAS